MDMLSITSKVVDSTRNPGGGWRSRESRWGMELARRCKNEFRSSSGSLSPAEGDEASPSADTGVCLDRISLSRGPTIGGPVSVQ